MEIYYQLDYYLGAPLPYYLGCFCFLYYFFFIR